MKAYHVHDKNESGEEAMHEVVFAETPAQAKFKSDAYSSGTDWNNISIRRVPFLMITQARKSLTQLILQMDGL